MPLIVLSWYTKELLNKHPDYLFVFGDNAVRKGTGGQARACRDQPNTVGIITKRAPSYEAKDFFYEKDFEEWKKLSAPDFKKVRYALAYNGTVVWPEDGVGTGRANLKENAPSILAYIEEFYKEISVTYGKNLTP